LFHQHEIRRKQEGGIQLFPSRIRQEEREETKKGKKKDVTLARPRYWVKKEEEREERSPVNLLDLHWRKGHSWKREREKGEESSWVELEKRNRDLRPILTLDGKRRPKKKKGLPRNPAAGDGRERNEKSPRTRLSAETGEAQKMHNARLI